MRDLLVIDVLREKPPAARQQAGPAPLVGARARGIADKVRLRNASEAAARR